MKKLVIVLFVACALPAVAAPPHQKPGIHPQYHAAAAFERGTQERSSDSTADRRASKDTTQTSTKENTKATQSPGDQR